MTRITIVNKKRFMFTIIIIIFILFFGLFFSIYAIINKAECTQDIKYIEVYVQDGDTIWNIAKQYVSNNRDIRDLIYEIGQINNLKDYNIYPGDIIRIPIE